MRPTVRRFVRISAAFGLVLVLVDPPSAVHAQSADDVLPVCGKPITATDNSARLRPARAILAVPESEIEKTNFRLKRDWSARTRNVTLSAGACEFDSASELKVIPESFESADYRFRGSITGTGTVDADGAKLVLTVTPSGKSKPGTYLGTVRIEGPNVAPLVMPVTVTLQYRHPVWLLVIVGALSLLVVPVIVWMKGRLSGNTDSLREWVGNWVTPSVALLTLGAIYVPWKSQYWDNEGWGGNLIQWVSLLTTCLGAHLLAFGALLPSNRGGIGTQTAQPADGDAGSDVVVGGPADELGSS